MLATATHNQSDMASLPLPYDPGEGTPVPVLVLDEGTAVGVLTVGQLLDYVPDPIAAEDTPRVVGDSMLLGYGWTSGVRSGGR